MISTATILCTRSASADPVHGEHLRCVVVTREAHDASGEVHHRMPGFLDPEAANACFKPKKLNRGGGEEMLAILDSQRTVDAGDPTVIQPAWAIDNHLGIRYLSP